MDTFWRWLGTAPPKVIIILVIFLAGGFTSWLYTVEGQTADMRSHMMVVAEQAREANDNFQDTSARIAAINAKLDELIRAVGQLQGEMSARNRYQERSYSYRDMQPQPHVNPVPLDPFHSGGK